MNKWQRMIETLIANGSTMYQIAKVCAKDDRHKVKRWREGRSIPDAEEGPLLEREYQGVPSQTRDVTSRSSFAKLK